MFESHCEAGGVGSFAAEILAMALAYSTTIHVGTSMLFRIAVCLAG